MPTRIRIRIQRLRYRFRYHFLARLAFTLIDWSPWRKLMFRMAEAMLDPESGLACARANSFASFFGLGRHYTDPSCVWDEVARINPKHGYLVTSAKDDRFIGGACSIILYAF